MDSEQWAVDSEHVIQLGGDGVRHVAPVAATVAPLFAKPVAAHSPVVSRQLDHSLDVSVKPDLSIPDGIVVALSSNLRRNEEKRVTAVSGLPGLGRHRPPPGRSCLPPGAVLLEL